MSRYWVRGYRGRRQHGQGRSMWPYLPLALLILWLSYGTGFFPGLLLFGVIALLLRWMVTQSDEAAAEEEDEAEAPASRRRWHRRRRSPAAVGDEGEREVQYALKWLDQTHQVMHDLIVKSPNYDAQQFDHLVIGPPGVISLETKNYAGTLRIDPYGVWTQQTREENPPQRIQSPVFQVQRHRAVLRDLLPADVPIHDLIVIANQGAMIEGREHCPVPVVTADTLLQTIQSLTAEPGLSPGQVLAVYQAIADHVVEGRQVGT